MDTRDHTDGDAEHAEHTEHTECFEYMDVDGEDDGMSMLDGGDYGDTARIELHAALRAIVDGLPAAPDPLPAILRRAHSLKRRQRTVRTIGAAAAFTALAAAAPPVLRQIDSGLPGSGAGIAAAGPPAAVLALPTAFPDIVATAVPIADPPVPANALNWTARGSSAPLALLDAAGRFGTDQPGPAGSGPPVRSAVYPLWAGPDGTDHSTWVLVAEEWNVKPFGAGTAQLLVLWGNPTKDPPGLSATTVPIAFTHPAPGSVAGPGDVANIAEISVWLPVSGWLLVLGAPQVKTVYYAPTDGRFVAQATTDGVAMFPRTKILTHGLYTDLVQVRDSRNRSLTPPKGWTVPDVSTVGTAGSGPTTSFGQVPGTVTATGAPSGTVTVYGPLDSPGSPFSVAGSGSASVAPRAVTASPLAPLPTAVPLLAPTPTK